MINIKFISLTFRETRINDASWHFFLKSFITFYKVSELYELKYHVQDMLLFEFNAKFIWNWWYNDIPEY